MLEKGRPLSKSQLFVDIGIITIKFDMYIESGEAFLHSCVPLFGDKLTAGNIRIV